MAKKFELNFKLGAQMAASFAKTMTNAQSAMGQLSTHIAQVNKQAGSNQKIINMRDAVSKASFEFTTASARADQLRKNLQKTEKPSAKLAAELKVAEREADRAGKKLHTLRDRLEETERSTNTAHKSTAQLSAEQLKLEQSAQKAAGAQKRLGDALDAREKNRQDQSKIRGDMLKTAAAAAAFGVPIKMAADFHQQMTSVAAIGDLTASQQERLSKTARDLGKSTIFSAKEAAEGMQYLAMAGFETNEIIEAMPGMLNLAAAGNLDLGTTADIASDTLAAFGLAASESGRVADVLAKTATSSNTNIEMLGDTMKYVAPVARSAGMSLEETSAMAGLLANVGIKSSQAGTTMKSMLVRLAKPSGKAAALMEDLGISVADSEGNMRNMVEILGDVAAATENMGSQERLAAITEIFGREPAAGMAELIEKGGSDAISAYVEIMEKSGGTAEKVAKKMMEGPWGRFKTLQSAAEELAITIGDVMLPTIIAMVDKVTEAVSSIAEWANEHPRLTSFVIKGTAAIIGLRMAILSARYAITLVRSAVISYQIALATAQKAQILFTSGSKAMRVAQLAGAGAMKVMRGATLLFSAALWANPITWVVAGIAGLVAAGYLLWKNWDKVSEFLSGMWQKIKDGAGAAMEYVKNVFVGAWEKVKSFLGSISLFDSGKKLLQTLIDGIKAMGGKLVETVKGSFSKVRDLLPFSDAKIGPFSELTASGAAIMETLGAGIKKAGSNPIVSPFVDAADNVIGGARNMGGRLGGALGVSGGGAITLNLEITQNITLNGDSASARAEARSGARQGADELAKEIEKIMERQRRLGFSG